MRTSRKEGGLMAHRLGIATVCLSGTLEDKLTAAASAGFTGVEIFENDLVAAASTPEEIRARCTDLGLSIDLYQPFRDFEAVPPAELARNLRRAERKFDQMLSTGYAGPLSLEVFNDVFRQANPHRTAVDAMRSLLDLQERHGRRFH